MHTATRFRSDLPSIKNVLNSVDSNPLKFGSQMNAAAPFSGILRTSDIFAKAGFGQGALFYFIS
jgi:hypothetical protein